MAIQQKEYISQQEYWDYQRKVQYNKEQIFAMAKRFEGRTYNDFGPVHIDEVKEILKTNGVKRILLDNFDYENTKKAVEIIGGRCETESSGGITEKTISEYAKCNVDFISVGALTHSINNFDLSLKAI